MAAPPSGVTVSGSVTCEKCGKPARFGIEPECRACYWPNAMHAPNVQIARQIEVALQERFDATQQKAAEQAWEPLFERAVKLATTSSAVVAVEVNFAFDFFSDARMLYGPYASQVRARLRAPANDVDDGRRRVVDSLIYGGYGEEINFAALSADGRGISSWGTIYLRLDSQAIGYRSTVLEENAYKFVAAHGLSAGNIHDRLKVLAGHLSVWDSRHMLVVSKFASQLATLLPSADLDGILLNPGSSRADADFLEVHVFGPFNHQAVEEIRADTVRPQQQITAVLFSAFQELALQVLGKPVQMI